MPIVPSSTSELVHRARALLAEGRSLLTAPAPAEAELGGARMADDLLGLYERLRGRLAAIEGNEVGELLGEISETVEELSRLADDLDRVHSLRSALGDPL